MPTSSADSFPAPFGSRSRHPLDHSCCRFFFRALSTSPTALRRRHRLRVIPAWAGIFFFTHRLGDSPRFIHHGYPRARERRRRKNPLAGREESGEKASRSESRWRLVVIVVARVRLAAFGMVIDALRKKLEEMAFACE